MKILSKLSNKIKHETLEGHKWICSSKVCFETLKELEKTMITNWNVWKLEKQLKKCNKCYLEMKNCSQLSAMTRWTISAEIHYYNSKHKHKNK